MIMLNSFANCRQIMRKDREIRQLQEAHTELAQSVMRLNELLAQQMKRYPLDHRNANIDMKGHMGAPCLGIAPGDLPNASPCSHYKDEVGHRANSNLGSPIDTPPSSPVERIREAIRASAAVNSSETVTPPANQDDDLFSAPISPVVDDSNDSDYDDEVVIVENPDRSKKYWVYEDETLAEVQRYRQAMKAGLCDHRYQGPLGQYCTQPRAECIERKLGNHGDQCRWITTKNMARCKASIKQCPQHRQWAPQSPPGKLFRRELSTRPQGVNAREFFLCARQSFKQEFTGSDKKKPRII
ncbi:hypothetical protein Ae201684P_019724 [Aphanomyces euteiches]|nr:hypothetical protein Ae201684P_019724 [Aphanomyces euteiches]